MRNFTPILCLCLTMSFSAVVDASGSKHSHHHHSQLDVSNLSEKPKVELTVTKDAASGWNIHAKTTNFRFAPEHVNNQHITGEGHAHLYVDGKKITRLYSEWFHLGNLSQGSHLIKVSLNANDHSALVLNGKTVSSEVEVTQK